MHCHIAVIAFYTICGILLVTSISVREASIESSCYYRASDGSEYLLYPLSSTSGYVYNTSLDKTDYTFYINICADTTLGECTLPSPVCQRSSYGSYHSLGRLSTQQFSDLTMGSPNQGVSVTYKSGEFCYVINKLREVTINLICNPALSSTVVTHANEIEECKYEIRMESPFACPVRDFECQMDSATSGLSYDLRSLILPDKGNQSYYYYSDPNYDYGFNLCGLTDFGCDPKTTAVCQHMSFVPLAYWSCGAASTLSIDDSESDLGVIVSYSSGDRCSTGSQSRSTNINLKCNPDQPGLKVISVEENPVCNYVFQAESERACPLSYRTCKFTDSQGFSYNLQGMVVDPTEENYDYKVTPYLFEVNICGNALNTTCNGDGFFTPVCQTDTSGSYGLGSLSTQKFVDYPSEGGKGVSVVYTDGSTQGCYGYGARTVKINVACHKGVNPGIITRIWEPSFCRYEIEMASVYACPIANNTVIDL